MELQSGMVVPMEELRDQFATNVTMKSTPSST